MSVPNSTYTEIVTTAIANYRSTLADNVLAHNPVLAQMEKAGNVDTCDGGSTILENLMYAENGTFGWYSGYEALDVSASDTLTSANFSWKQANCNVTLSGLEKMQNAGKSRMFDLIKSRILVADKTMRNNIAAAIFYSNTESSGKAIGGLQHLIQDAPGSATVGGIAESGNSWWQNQYYDFSDNSQTASSSTIQHAMNSLWLDCLRGRDMPNLIVAGDTYYTYFHESLQPQQRFTSAMKAVGGFAAIAYQNNVPVVFDPNCSSTRMYFLNTDYLKFRPHRDRNFVTENDKISVNQDAIVIPLYWGGNMTSSNRSLQGVIVA